MTLLQETRVKIPEGMQAEATDKEVKLSKAGKTVAKAFKADNITISKDGNEIVVKADKLKRKKSAVITTIASKIRNMVLGLEKGYEYKMEIVYSHFPMNVSVKGDIIEINNLCGGKNPKIAKIVGIVKVEIKGKEIFVRGAEKDDVGQTCANLEQVTKLRGKDTRIFQDGIYLVKKGIAE